MAPTVEKDRINTGRSTWFYREDEGSLSEAKNSVSTEVGKVNAHTPHANQRPARRLMLPIPRPFLHGTTPQTYHFPSVTITVLCLLCRQ
jgi:hypothetical protein